MKNICKKVIKELKKDLKEMGDMSLGWRREVGIGICQDKNGSYVKTLKTFAGKPFYVDISRECPSNTEFVGELHTHLGSKYFNPVDLRYATVRNSDFICILYPSEEQPHILRCMDIANVYKYPDFEDYIKKSMNEIPAVPLDKGLETYLKNFEKELIEKFNVDLCEIQIA